MVKSEVGDLFSKVRYWEFLNSTKWMEHKAPSPELLYLGHRPWYILSAKASPWKKGDLDQVDDPSSQSKEDLHLYIVIFAFWEWFSEYFLLAASSFVAPHRKSICKCRLWHKSNLRSWYQNSSQMTGRNQIFHVSLLSHALHKRRQRAKEWERVLSWTNLFLKT